MKTKAIVFVDVQKDFIDGALKNEQAIAVTPKIVEFAKSLRAKMEAGTGSFYKFYATRDTHEKTQYDCPTGMPEPREGYLATLEGKKLPVEHCIEGTDGWMIDDRLMDIIDGKVTIVNKPTFGSFDLAEIINEDFFETVHEDTYTGATAIFKPTNDSLDEIIICGFCTDICCISCGLLLRAKFPNTKITVMKDLCAGTTKENHEAALKVMQSCQIDIK